MIRCIRCIGIVSVHFHGRIINKLKMLTKALMQQRRFSTGVEKIKVQMKPLPFEMGALEPVMSGHLLDFHYGKHHRTYVNNLNQLLE